MTDRRIGIIAVACGVLLLGALIGIAAIVGRDPARSGGLGQECYPNDTCDAGFACWQHGTIKRRACYSPGVAPKPVPPAGAKFYYVQLGRDGSAVARTFEDAAECMASLSARPGQTVLRVECGNGR